MTALQLHSMFAVSAQSDGTLQVKGQPIPEVPNHAEIAFQGIRGSRLEGEVKAIRGFLGARRWS